MASGLLNHRDYFLIFGAAPGGEAIMGAAIYNVSAHLGAMRHVHAPRRPRVLVVDDEEPVRRMVRDILEDEGFEVVAANSAREGLALALHLRPDVIICDLMMPGMNGREFHARLVSDWRLARIPVLLISAAYRRQPNDSFAGVIAKPFAIDELVRQVQRHLGA